MFRRFRFLWLALVAFFSISSLALADYDYPDEQQQQSYFSCDKVAELAYDSNVDLLFCKVGRNQFCFATSEGQLDCDYSSNFSYRAGDYGRRWNNCRQVTNISSRGGGGYPLSRERIEVCSIGSGRRAIKCFVSSSGGLDCI